MLAVRIGPAGARTRQVAEVLGRHGAVRHAELPPDPDRSTLDGVLSTVDGARLVVLADLAGLNRVVHRLLRRSLLAGTPVAAVLDDPQWMVAAGLPADPVAAAAVAGSGEPASSGLVRDDRGGVVLGAAALRPLAGRAFGLRAYVEDTELADARVRALTVTPDLGRLRATARAGGLRPARTAHGRAVTLRCEPARLTVDGRAQEQPCTRATWWYEPDCWQLVRPA